MLLNERFEIRKSLNCLISEATLITDEMIVREL